LILEIKTSILSSKVTTNIRDRPKKLKPGGFLRRRADTDSPLYSGGLIVATALTPDELQRLHYQGE
jgi:hypothetical protein